MTTVPDDDPAAVFADHRPVLYGLAYRLLGSASDAEEVLQEAFVRWYDADRASITTPAAWLTTIVTRLGLDQLRTVRRRREVYPGTWLPEPVLTGDLGPLETAEQRDSVSLGVLTLLEGLSPPERAVFVLHEAFAFRHRDVADVLDVDEPTCRQWLHRARRHLDGGRPRFGVDPAQHRRLVDRFMAATLDGDVDGLARLLADDVVSWADGGGDGAARRPVRGRERVLRYLGGLGSHPGAAGVVLTAAEVNAEPAALVWQGSRLLAVVALESDGHHITTVRFLAAPAKVARLARRLDSVPSVPEV
ncbi:RNA polymerase sigma factor SigJ [Actinomycetospora aeridis]|uniref:RNA polymerase sigma factor SigJ n=1 Tax=Actinomycetospora aeridis TaxID=3129231 RepID=A0ABU8NAW3_9PSEU